jgi:hypothetical protein
MNLQGKIIEIYDAKQVSPTFTKREFIVEYASNPSYPQYVKFDLLQDKVSLIDSYSVGDKVDVQFEIKGKPYTNKNNDKIYYNSLNAWKIELVASKGDLDNSYDYSEIEPANPSTDEGIPF